jgi:two-component system, sensor histidine kinase FlrB
MRWSVPRRRGRSAVAEVPFAHRGSYDPRMSAPRPAPDPAAAIDPAALQAAFTLFNEASAQLSVAYEDLQGRVERLTGELAAANAELRRHHEEKEALARQLARRERLAEMGEMAAGLAHQLRTPLATALLYTGHLAKPDLPAADRVRFAERTRERLRHLERMVREMLLFVRGGTVARETVSLAALLDEVCASMEPQMAARDVRLVRDGPGAAVFIHGEHKALGGALTNLIENALQASPPGATVRVGVRQDATGAVAIDVVDAGPGIAADVQHRLFEPFFTTRSEGTGLGLAIVRAVVEAHSGQIEVRSAPGEGATFTVTLPLLGAVN